MRKKREPKYECVCPGCGSQFLGKQRNTRFCSHSCYLKGYVEDNPEKISAIKYKHQHSPKGKAKRKLWEIANADEIKRKDHEYYEANKEDILAKSTVYAHENRESINFYKLGWQKTETGRKNSLQSRRRRIARKLNAPGSHTIDEFYELCAEYEDHCLCCLKKMDRPKLSIDHIVPISKGGSDGIENLQPLCRRCNTRKGIHTIDYRPTFHWRGASKQ